MKVPSELFFFHDRMPVADLGSLNEPLLAAMQQWNIGKVDNKKHIQFCGMVQLANAQTAVFLPRSMDATTLEAASLTMNVLSRFGRETTSRELTSDGETGNPGVLSVIKKLAEDFRTSGIFSERQYVRSRNTGKPDWKRTVSREIAFISTTGNVVYPNISTTKPLDSKNNLLAQIQAAVVREIIDQHGWWLNGARSRRSELSKMNFPTQSRKLWLKLLEGLLPRLYSSRAIFLANYLIYYLRNCRPSASGSYVFGVEDFHTVWETMLRHTLIGVENGWNARLPKPVYELSFGNRADAPTRGMRTDIVVKLGDDYIIIDAKYYEASSANTAPGASDIIKQLFYEKALRTVIGKNPSIRNAFLFPISDGFVGKLSGVKFIKANNSVAMNFSPIECHYFEISSVMAAYVGFRRDLHAPELVRMKQTNPFPQRPKQG
tara:strand:- start:226 stop:1524 length:1299 start_codon:yes stop_codon:yes gene_type:complete